jgi:D-amino-acid dehydrogenase
LLVQPRLDHRFFRWSWEFRRASSPARYRAGLEASVALLRRTFELYDELLRAGVSFELHRTGMIVAALTQRGLDEYVEMIEDAQEAGYEGPVEVLGSAGLRRREPALSEAAVGGLHVAAERYVRPEELTRALVTWLRNRGAEIQEGSEVRGLERQPAGWRLDTPGGAFDAECVVLAAGAWSARLLGLLGIEIAFEGAKGYSVTARGDGTPPKHALYMAEAKTGASPFGDAVRIAGIFDLTGLDSTLRRRRIRAILRSSLPYFRDWQPTEVESEWAGLRPYPGDGLPVVGPVPGHDGLLVATGHGRMGITMAPATGEAISVLAREGLVPPEIRPFGLERLLR